MWILLAALSGAVAGGSTVLGTLGGQKIDTHHATPRRPGGGGPGRVFLN